MALTGKKKTTRPGVMMVDSGITSHMTSQSEKVTLQQTCSISIYLADDSIVSATQMGVRKVKWQCQSGLMTVSHSRTIVAPDIKKSLLSVPALVKKDIAALFVPGKAMLIDLLDENKILGYAR